MPNDLADNLSGLSSADSGRPQLVFVGGLQRSGTTLLARLLAEHPDITGLVETPTEEDEGQFLQDVYPNDHDLGRRGGRLRGTSMRWAFNPLAHLTEVSDEEAAPLARQLLASWRPYWQRPEAPVYVEKSPSNLTRTRLLQSLFPTARFVVVTRHPLVQALAVRKWGTIPTKIGYQLEAVVRHWFHAMAIFRADAIRLRHVKIVPYEDLIRDPQSTLSEVARFCGLAPHSIEPSLVREPAQYIDYWAGFATGFNSMPFRSLTPGDRLRDSLYRMTEHWVVQATGKAQAAQIVRNYHSLAPRYGYRLDQLDRAYPWNPPLVTRD